MFIAEIDEVLTHSKSQGLDLDYMLNKAKTNASVVEGRIYKGQRDSFRRKSHFDLDAEDIDDVWKRCMYQLRRAIQNDSILANHYI